MNWKFDSRIIEQTDIDYLCHNKSVLRLNFVGYLLLLDTVFKIPNGKLEYTILRYIENVQTVSSIKVQFLQYKAQKNIIYYFYMLHTILLLIPF